MRTQGGAADRSAGWVPTEDAVPELHVCSAVSHALLFDLAGVMIGDDMNRRTVLVGSDARLRRFGDLQQSMGGGPGHDALRGDVPVVAADVWAETDRWPLLLAAGTAPVRSLALVPLHVGDPADRRPREVLGLLITARSWVQPFTTAELDVLGQLATLVTRMLLHRRPGSLTSRDAVPTTPELAGDDLGVALGMVMAAVPTDATGALSRLRARAFMRGCTVHELATEIVAGRSPAGDDHP